VSPGIEWPAARGVTSISPGEVHVWAASLDVSNTRLARLGALLSEDEHNRAARFRQAVHMQRYVTARGFLRTLLGRYLGADPRDMRFQYDEHGKPALAGPTAGVGFNVSHSRDLALLAVSRGHVQLGVDVEVIAPFDSMSDVASRFFSLVERQQLDRAPRSAYEAHFYRCWTRKEAYLKAIGTGLLTPLDSFDVTILDDAHATLLRDARDAGAPSRWSLVHLAPASGYVGALAVDLPNPAVHCWQLGD
jgi:4'-phosphopantetheinyl transferase